MSHVADVLHGEHVGAAAAGVAVPPIRAPQTMPIMRARPKLLWRGLQPLLSRILTPRGRSMAATAMSVTHMEVMVPML